MNCEDLKELLSAYADGELSRTQQEFVEEHLAGCPVCRDTLKKYIKVSQQIAYLKEAPTPQDLTGKTMARIKDNPRQPARHWVRPALAAVPVLVILIALLILQPWGGFQIIPGPQIIIANVYAVTEGLTSYRVNNSIVYTYQGVTTEQFLEWEYMSPDRQHGKLTVEDGTIEFIIIGDKQYIWGMDNSTGSLQLLTASFGSIHSKDDTLQLLDLLNQIEKLPDETISGVDCLHLQGEVDMERQAEKVKAALGSANLKYNEIVQFINEQLISGKEVVEIWIGKDDYIIRQIERSGQVFINGEYQDTYSSIVNYFDFDKPIVIEPPLDIAGELLPGWQCIYDSLQSPGGPIFSSDIDFTVDGDNPARQWISFRIDINNISGETARNIRISLTTPAANEGEWVWNSPGGEILGPDENKIYNVSWEYDASQTSSEELAKLINLTTIIAHYINTDGEEVVELIFPDEPYPISTPPNSPGE
jgi:hypothetical protein